MSKGRTYESRPVPGSEDALHPLAWAERLFDLKELRKDFKPCEEPSPILMVCRLKPWKGIHFYEKGFLEKYGMGPTTKLRILPIARKLSENLLFRGTEPAYSYGLKC
nr:unnamed protein product [Spirometra erinaceieuropaei]